MYGSSDRSHVAWDIETTGFGWDDRITVMGFWWPGGHADLLLNTNGTETASDMAAYEQQLSSVSGGVPVTVQATETESALLEAMGQLVFEKFDRTYNRLVAFNAESWKGGFDLPFVRTRCLAHGYDWFFDGIQFADIWDVLKKRLNTTHRPRGTKSVDDNTLVGAHQILFSQPDIGDALRTAAPDDHQWYREHRYDPFEDSGSAVAHYRRGEFLPVCQHNLANVHRTWEIAEVIREYTSSKDISTKKL